MNKYRAKSLIRTGEYDFINHKIVLHKFSEVDIVKIEAAIGNAWEQSENIDEISENIEIRSLIKHELTHFIDTTTTLWGLEYAIRKNMVIKSKSNSEKTDNAVKVFMLNTSEILMHDILFEEVELVDFKYDEIKHQYTYDDRFGTVIWLVFMFEGTSILKTPISMLSILENHALCVELLSKIHDSKKIKDVYLQNAILAKIEREYNEYLKNSKLTEYTSLLHVCHRHYVIDLGVEYQYCLRFLNEICEFSLNINDFEHMSKFANFIEKTNQDRYLGDQICHELRRGMSRYYIAFKLILYVYSWLVTDGSETQTKLKIIKEDPRKAINETLNFCGLDFKFNEDKFGDYVRDINVNMAEGNCSKIDSCILDKFYRKNIELLQRKKIYETDIREFSCFKILTKEENEELNLFENTSSIIENLEYSMDDEIFLDQQLRDKFDVKFHMPPQQTFLITERLVAANRS